VALHLKQGPQLSNNWGPPQLSLLSDNDYTTIRSFAVCRNPFSRALATYRHFQNKQWIDPTEFEQFCEHWFDKDHVDHNRLSHQRRQIDFVRDIRGNIGVDRILRFESLSTDFRNLSEEWSFATKNLPHVGKQGVDCASYRAHYTARARELISLRFSEDLDIFGYQF
jgi:hypothetical protein